jgi:hypothetical protein
MKEKSLMDHRDTEDTEKREKTKYYLLSFLPSVTSVPLW